VKRDLYALADVRELWFGDVEAPSLQILALRDGQYVPIPETNSIIESTVIPGLRVDANDVLNDLDAID
ncbi:MAG TPA: hypothetical protein VGR08_08120, partial [Thermomicrobiales bacterium]|nr:hypothetical protein [Thermomicrobiales bacterium]